jgi:hypothetical protein
VLSVVSPLSFSRAARIRDYVRHMAEVMRLPNLWEFELASMLSQIGCIALPPDILEKVEARQALSPQEESSFLSYPSVGAGLIGKIPRLEVIAEIVRHQRTPLRDLRDPKITDVTVAGAQMLMIAMYFDNAVSRGGSPSSALRFMRERPEEYQTTLVNAMETAEVSALDMAAKTITVADLRVGMVANEDIRTKNGLFLVAKNQVISEALVARLKNFHRTTGLVEPIAVLAPAPQPKARESLRVEQLVRA